MEERTPPFEPPNSPEFSTKNVPLALQARLVQGGEATKPTNTNLPDVSAESLTTEWQKNQANTIEKLSYATTKAQHDVWAEDTAKRKQEGVTDLEIINQQQIEEWSKNMVHVFGHESYKKYLDALQAVHFGGINYINFSADTAKLIYQRYMVERSEMGESANFLVVLDKELHLPANMVRFINDALRAYMTNPETIDLVALENNFASINKIALIFGQPSAEIIINNLKGIVEIFKSEESRKRFADLANEKQIVVDEKDEQKEISRQNYLYDNEKKLLEWLDDGSKVETATIQTTPAPTATPPPPSPLPSSSTPPPPTSTPPPTVTPPTPAPVVKTSPSSPASKPSVPVTPAPPESSAAQKGEYAPEVKNAMQSIQHWIELIENDLKISTTDARRVSALGKKGLTLFPDKSNDEAAELLEGEWKDPRRRIEIATVLAGNQVAKETVGRGTTSKLESYEPFTLVIVNGKRITCEKFTPYGFVTPDEAHFNLSDAQAKDGLTEIRVALVQQILSDTGKVVFDRKPFNEALAMMLKKLLVESDSSEPTPIYFTPPAELMEKSREEKFRLLPEENFRAAEAFCTLLRKRIEKEGKEKQEEVPKYPGSEEKVPGLKITDPTSGTSIEVKKREDVSREWFGTGTFIFSCSRRDARTSIFRISRKRW